MQKSDSLNLLLRVCTIIREQHGWVTFEHIKFDAHISSEVLCIILGRIYRLNLIEIEVPESVFADTHTARLKTHIRQQYKRILDAGGEVDSVLIPTCIYRWKT